MYRISFRFVSSTKVRNESYIYKSEIVFDIIISLNLGLDLFLESS